MYRSSSRSTVKHSEGAAANQDASGIVALCREQAVMQDSKNDEKLKASDGKSDDMGPLLPRLHLVTTGPVTTVR